MMTDDADEMSPRDYLPYYLQGNEERQFSPDLTAKDFEAILLQLMDEYDCTFEELPLKIKEARRREAELN